MRSVQIAPNEDIGRTLRERAEARGYTQAKLGSLAGLGRSEVAKVYAGSYKKHKNYRAVARALGTTIEAISCTLTRTDAPDISPGAYVIAVSSLKGGSGKTTTSVHLAGGLARRGYRVLFVDLDSSCQGHHWLRDSTLEDGLQLPELMDVLCRRERDGVRVGLEDTLVPSTVEGVEVVRSSAALEDLDLTLGTTPASERRLMRALEPLASRFDFVVMDTAPSNKLSTKMALMAADSMLIPMCPTATDIDRFYRFMPWLFEFIEDPDLNPELGLLGVLLCMVNQIGPFERDLRKAIQEDYPDVLFSTHIDQAKKYGRLLVEDQLIYTSNHDKAHQYMSVIDECLERIASQRDDVEEVCS